VRERERERERERVDKDVVVRFCLMEALLRVFFKIQVQKVPVAGHKKFDPIITAVDILPSSHYKTSLLYLVPHTQFCHCIGILY
jgi:hypothetical protein